MSEVRQVCSYHELINPLMWDHRTPTEWRTDHLMKLVRDVILQGWFPTAVVEYSDNTIEPFYHHRELRSRVMCAPLEPLE